MKTYTFVLLTASALAATAMECVSADGWSEVTLAEAPAADSDAAACNTACTTAVDADADKATKDFCCESAVTAKDDTKEPKVEAAHACALYKADTGAASISTAKDDAGGVTYNAWDYTAGV